MVEVVGYFGEVLVMVVGIGGEGVEDDGFELGWNGGVEVC